MNKRRVNLVELWRYLDLSTKCVLGVPLVILTCMGVSLLLSNWTVYNIYGQLLTGFDAIMARTVTILVLGVVVFIFGSFVKAVILDIYRSRRYLLQCHVEKSIEFEVNQTLQDKSIFEKAGILEGTYKYYSTEKDGIIIRDGEDVTYTVKPELLLRDISLYDEYFKYN